MRSAVFGSVGFSVRKRTHNRLITLADFGMHSLYFPGVPANAPTISYGTVRTHDWTKDYFGGGGCFAVAKWLNVETSDGVFDWADVDAFISHHKAAGRQVIFTMDGTPSIFVASPSGPGIYRNTRE